MDFASKITPIRFFPIFLFFSLLANGGFSHDLNLDRFNYIIGTQTIAPSYHFTDDEPLIETAKVIQNMGSTTLKFQFDENATSWKVLDLPFQYTFMWWNWWRSNLRWADGLTEAEREDEWNKTYNMTKKLLERYNNSGRVFFLGNWEGDWLLIGQMNPNVEPPSTAPQGMIDWFNIRQAAIDAAKRETPHENVEVYHYIEVNRVVDAMREGKTRVVNRVLPYVAKVDYVSYSSYDSQKLPTKEIHEILDYIESQTPGHPTIKSKRVFIGEFGVAARWVGYDGKKHERQNREIMLKYLSWGVPFLLYWELYNNEILYVNPSNPSQIKKPNEATPQEKKTWTVIHNGFWLIDDKNRKQPLYDTFERTLKRAKNYVHGFHERYQRLPIQSEYQSWLMQEFSTNPY